MSNGIKIAIGLIGLALVTFLGVVAMQPDTTHVERSLVIVSTPADTFPLANNFDKWLLWNPWQGLDPAQKNVFSESREGPGAWYTWEGNEDVGKGKMTIKSTKPPQQLKYDLEFIEPFASTAEITMTFAAEGDKTKVTWAFDGKNDFMGKAFGLFMDMDTMLGADFEKGLNMLKPLAEQVTNDRLAAEKAAAEAAAAAAVPAEGAATEAATAPGTPAPQ